MPRITLAQLARIAARLGHKDLSVDPRGNRWVASCSCGYRSTGRTSAALAAQAAAHHLEVIGRQFSASGKSIPDTPEELPKSAASSVA